MQTVDEQPETIHLYVVRGTNSRPPLYPIVFSALAFVALVLFCALTQFHQPVTRAVIRTPAVPLSIKTFTAHAAIVPTGIKTYPATTAHGVLTITNGSVIAQSLPSELTFVSSTGVSVITDEAAFVPAGSANGYGWTQVKAHAVVSGQRGNLPPYSINSVVGSSIFVRNTSSLYGGRDSYSVKYITSNDRSLALSNIRNMLSSKIMGLHYPCKENVSGNSNIQAVWVCQFVTYKIPSFMSVSNVRIIGKNLLIAVTFTPRFVRVGLK